MSSVIITAIIMGGLLLITVAVGLTVLAFKHLELEHKKSEARASIRPNGTARRDVDIRY